MEENQVASVSNPITHDNRKLLILLLGGVIVLVVIVLGVVVVLLTKKDSSNNKVKNDSIEEVEKDDNEKSKIIIEDSNETSKNTKIDSEDNSNEVSTTVVKLNGIDIVLPSSWQISGELEGTPQDLVPRVCMKDGKPYADICKVYLLTNDIVPGYEIALSSPGSYNFANGYTPSKAVEETIQFLGKSTKILWKYI